MFLNSARHMPRYAGASIARMKRGGVSKTTAGFVLAIGNPRHALAGWCDWMGDGVTAGWSTYVLLSGARGLLLVLARPSDGRFRVGLFFYGHGDTSMA